MSRTRLAKALLALTFGTATVLGVAAPASAHVTTTTAAVSAPASNGDVHPMAYVHYGWYQSLGECKAMGNALYDADIIQNYSCSYHQGEYELLVKYYE